MKTSLSTYFDKYVEYINLSPLHRILANDYELVTLEKSKTLLRKQVKTYDREFQFKYPFINFETFVKLFKPMIAGFTQSYLGNREPIYIALKSQFPMMKNVGIIKNIGPSEIEGGKLYGYYDLEYVLQNINKCTTLTHFFYFNWNLDIPYTFQPSQYPSSLNGLTKNKDAIFIMSFSYTQKEHPDYEIKSLPYMIKLTKSGLNSLNQDGDLYVEFTVPRTDKYIQFYYKIYQKFKRVTKIESVESNVTFLVYKSFNGSAKDDSANKLPIAHDGQLGGTTHPCRLTYDEFANYILTIVDSKISKLNKHIKKAMLIKSRLKNRHFFNKAYNFLISKGIEWSHANNMKINPYYDFKLKKLNETDIVKRFFPPTNYKNLMINFSTLYSIDDYRTTDQCAEIIRKHFGADKTILDGTAHIGANTISFAKHFKSVIAVEIDRTNYKYLCNNIKTYNLDNVQTIHGDFVKVINEKPQYDVLFLDPPWNSIYYKLEKSKDLFLSDINITDILKTDMNFCIKIPKNYNFTPFYTKYKQIYVYNLSHISLIIHKVSN